MSDITPDALVERLRAQFATEYGDPDGSVLTPRPLLRAAADTIDAARQENELLRAALAVHNPQVGTIEELTRARDEAEAREAAMAAIGRERWGREDELRLRIEALTAERDDAVAVLRELVEACAYNGRGGNAAYEAVWVKAHNFVSPRTFRLDKEAER